jgi:tetratricopeptide (TPR) repeat protein
MRRSVPVLVCLCVAILNLGGLWRSLRGERALKTALQAAAEPPGERESLMERAGIARPRDWYPQFCLGVMRFQSSVRQQDSARAFARSGAVPVQAGCLRSCGAAEFEKSLQLNAVEDGTMHNLAWVHAMAGDLQGATALLAQAVKTVPNDPVYGVSYGLALEKAGNTGAAQAEYARAIALRPSILQSDFFADLLARSSSLARGAEAEARKRLEKNREDPVAAVRLAEIDVFEGDAEAADALVSPVLSRLPNIGAAWSVRGDIDRESGQLKEAVLSYRRALFLDATPETAEHLLRLAPPQSSVTPMLKRIQEQTASHRMSPHALRTSVIYRPARLLTNDLVPADLLEYVFGR